MLWLRGGFNNEVLWLCVTNVFLAEYVEVTQHDLVQYMPCDDAATEVAEAAARGCRRALAKCVALRHARWRSVHNNGNSERVEADAGRGLRPCKVPSVVLPREASRVHPSWPVLSVYARASVVCSTIHEQRVFVCADRAE